MTKALKNTLPKLNETEGQGELALIRVHYFHPFSTWNWYGVEFDGRDIFYGLVVGHDIEVGYFSLLELEQIRIFDLPMEREYFWQKQTIKEIREYWERLRGA